MVSEMRLGFGHVFVKNLPSAGVGKNFRTLQPLRKPGGKRERSKSGVQELEALRLQAAGVRLISFVSLGLSTEKGRLTWDSMRMSGGSHMSLRLIYSRDRHKVFANTKVAYQQKILKNW